MPKYNVYVVVDAGFSLGDIEASTIEEAAEKARDLLDAHDGDFRVCHQCSDKLDVGDMTKLVIGEADGTTSQDFDI
jgi:hypothetical protein